jgi:hypothetical protein
MRKEMVQGGREIASRARPFEHYVIPRFTSLKLPSYQTEEKITPFMMRSVFRNKEPTNC